MALPTATADSHGCSNNSQNICSLLTPYIYQLKIKCQDGGSYFYKNQKYKPLEIKKIFSYFISEIPNCPYNFPYVLELQVRMRDCFLAYVSHKHFSFSSRL